MKNLIFSTGTEMNNQKEYETDMYAMESWTHLNRARTSTINRSQQSSNIY